MNKENIPTNLDEAVQYLVDSKDTPGGMSMRNNWGLWTGSELAQWFYTKEIYHADDMSAIIEESYKRHVKGVDRELDKQIAKYHKHWEKSLGPDHLNKMRKQVSEHIIKMRDKKINKIITKDI